MKSLKKIIKIVTGIVLFSVLIFSTLFIIKNNTTLEDTNMKQWYFSNESEQLKVINKTAIEEKYKRLLFDCLNKISSLPHSSEMMVKDAIALCVSGIQTSEQ